MSTAVPERRSEWRKVGLHVAALLFGTGLTFLMVLLLIVIFVYSFQVPVVSTLLAFIVPRDEGWAFVMLLLAAWILSVAATYGVIAWGLRAKATR